MIPAVPGIDSSTIAAIEAGPSSCTRRSRWAKERSHSSCSVVALNSERYRKGPKKWTTPSAP